MYKYYLTQRGPGPFCQPKGCSSTKDFGEKIFVKKIGCKAWGYANYEIPLTEKEINDYELVQVKEVTRTPFSEKGISDCTDCCRCCSEFECPANETRCQ
ncbi:hypothetical protein [Clostridium estertheticum]|uniref:defense against restriction DarA-related protein n=1 Tax=Clostridium estertheticum TaxID=238834 RepID=UPI001C7DAEC7|nr:hypothetical protein [Clostridium estertheticum]MBX4266576.1 hypothetical protein [Clostridium estertheticum]WLC88084.1 hypothetical protein KTC95_19015 [Clostridium estertheticum]